MLETTYQPGSFTSTPSAVLKPTSVATFHSTAKCKNKQKSIFSQDPCHRPKLQPFLHGLKRLLSTCYAPGTTLKAGRRECAPRAGPRTLHRDSPRGQHLSRDLDDEAVGWGRRPSAGQCRARDGRHSKERAVRQTSAGRWKHFRLFIRGATGSFGRVLRTKVTGDFFFFLKGFRVSMNNNVREKANAARNV